VCAEGFAAHYSHQAFKSQLQCHLDHRPSFNCAKSSNSVDFVTIVNESWTMTCRKVSCYWRGSLYWASIWIKLKYDIGHVVVSHGTRILQTKTVLKFSTLKMTIPQST